MQDAYRDQLLLFKQCLLAQTKSYCVGVTTAADQGLHTTKQIAVRVVYKTTVKCQRSTFAPLSGLAAFVGRTGVSGCSLNLKAPTDRCLFTSSLHGLRGAEAHGRVKSGPTTTKHSSLTVFGEDPWSRSARQAVQRSCVDVLP